MSPLRKPQNSYHPRSAYQRAPLRARVGLAMRRSMNFGVFGDIEPAIQARGLSLAPISTGDSSLTVSGVTVLATAQPRDIESGALKGLLVPGGSTDEEGVAALKILIDAAREKGVPILAFGEGVVQTVRAIGGDPADYVDAPAIAVEGDTITPLADMDQLVSATGRIG
ncbi:MAG: hypothetical protein Q8O54_03910 [Brevundimonas sp.]|nr:hypothetical protein [Brevundimonas sp.]